MIVTQQLVSVNFSEVPFPIPTTWDLSTYIPNGALDVSQVQVRVRPTGGYWQPWSGITAFDATTNVATFTSPLHLDQVEFRRATPRYAAYLDPKAPSSRVSQKNLQTNADQGLFVAVEWAAQYGIDAYVPQVLDPATAPNQLGLVQQTQNYWTTRDYTKTSWDFQFAGGYLDRSHVHAQVLLSTGWQQLTIDPSDPHADDPDAPVTAPFRFIGDFTLHMDFSTLAELPQALIIYRFTPRSVHVDSPLDNARITAPGMEPSATWAFFVAVEIGEELAKTVPPCECEQYYTTLLLPQVTTDILNGANSALSGVSGYTVGEPFEQFSTNVVNDDSISAVLTSTLEFLEYTNYRDVNPELFHTGVMDTDGVSATITVVAPTIEYVVYDHYSTINPDLFHQNVINSAGVSGVLTITISFITYDHYETVNPDLFHTNVVSNISATLT